MKQMQFTALCRPEYMKSPEELAPSRAPRWMKQSLAASAVLFAALLGGTLFGPMDEYVQTTGEVRPADYTIVFSPAGGVLQTVLVKEGDEVKAGAVVARLDPWEADKRLAKIDRELAEARIEFQLAQAARQKVEAVPVPAEFFFSPVEKERQQEVVDVQSDTHERLERLQKSGGVSMVEMLNHRLQLIAAESQLKRNEQAKALLEGAYGKAAVAEAKAREDVVSARIATLEGERELALEERARCEILATEGGKVLALTRRFPGEPVPLGAPVLKLSRGERQELRLYATEDRLPFVKPGQLVRFQAKSNADKLARPALARVDEVAVDRDLADSPSEPKGSYRITATVEASEYPLPNGAEVTAEIVLEKRAFWQYLLARLSDSKQ